MRPSAPAPNLSALALGRTIKEFCALDQVRDRFLPFSAMRQDEVSRHDVPSLKTLD
jgi:hypothetical protein